MHAAWEQSANVYLLKIIITSLVWIVKDKQTHLKWLQNSNDIWNDFKYWKMNISILWFYLAEQLKWGMTKVSLLLRFVDVLLGHSLVTGVTLDPVEHEEQLALIKTHWKQSVRRQVGKQVLQAIVDECIAVLHHLNPVASSAGTNNTHQNKYVSRTNKNEQWPQARFPKRQCNSRDKTFVINTCKILRDKRK